MFKTDSEIYQLIADDLYNIRDADWIMTTLNVERTSSNVIGYSGEYITNFGETKQLLNVWDEGDDLDDALESLFQIMTSETDKHKWNRLKITLENGGDLNIKFEWDQELADEIEKLSNEYDPRWDNTLTQEEKNLKYAEMVKSGELPDLSDINIK